MSEEQRPATQWDRSPAAGFSVGDVWALLRRRRGPMIIIAVSVLLLAVALALLWPATYRAAGNILIERQELPADLVPSTITSFADQRIQIIGQRVMTTDNLLHIIDRYNLYPEMRRKQPREVLLAQMRKDIRLQMISADVIDPRQGHPTKANIAFTVSFDSGSPETAARVANEIISLYLDENVKSRRQLTADAERFLDDQANKLNRNITQMEASITSFKDKHLNKLPDRAASNRESLLRREDEVREIDAQLSMLDQQSMFLNTQLAQQSRISASYTSGGERVMSPQDRLKVLRTEYARLVGLYSPEHPDVQRVQQEMQGLEKEAGGSVDTTNDIERQIADYRSQLALLRQTDAPDHPDVVRLQQQIDALTRTLGEPASPRAPQPEPASMADNPTYVQLQTQLETNRIQRESLLKRQEDVRQRMSDLEERVAAAPGIEREFADMARALEDEQIKYREVRQKQLSAKLSENLEDEQKGERFTLIDPPRVPEQPASPNRKLMLGGGVALSLVAALLTAVMLESLDGTVRNRRELETLLEVPPLAILPLVETRADRARHLRRRWLTAAATAGMCGLALGLTHWFYRPLDMLWVAALRRLGG